MKNLFLLSNLFADSTYSGGLFDSTDLKMMGGIVLLGIIISILAFAYVFFVRIYIAYRMAKNRHRDPLLWVLLSFFVSPILTWILLLVMGDESEKTKGNEIAHELEQELKKI